MIKKIVLVRAKPGMAKDDFFKYWFEQHAPLAHAVPEIRRYIQNHVTQVRGDRPDIPTSGAPFDGIVETWYDTVEAMERANTTPEGAILRTDSTKFVGSIQAYYVDEKIIIDRT